MEKGKRRTVSLTAESVTIYVTLAEELSIMTTHGGGPPRAAVGKLLALIAGSLDDGTIDLSGYQVQRAQLRPSNRSTP